MNGNQKQTNRTHPLYRKRKNGKEFMKLNSNGACIIIKLSPFRANGQSFAIVHSDNPRMIKDFDEPENSTESNRDEFEKVYGNAQFHLCKTNCEQ
jgi:hypothetical protein